MMTLIITLAHSVAGIHLNRDQPLRPQCNRDRDWKWSHDRTSSRLIITLLFQYMENLNFRPDVRRGGERAGAGSHEKNEGEKSAKT